MNPRGWNVERHGAIRVGTAEELATASHVSPLIDVSRQLLRSVAGRRTGSTPPRFAPLMTPRWRESVSRFTSLRDLNIANEALRQRAADILSRRDIFTSRCRELIAF